MGSDLLDLLGYVPEDVDAVVSEASRRRRHVAIALSILSMFLSSALRYKPAYKGDLRRAYRFF